MPYYAGDYYRGDYYAGGFSFGGLFRGIKRAARVVVGGGVGFLTGGPGGAIRGAIGGTGGAIASGIREETLAAGDEGSAYTPALRAKHQAALLRGSPGGGSPKPGTSIVPMGQGPMLPAGAAGAMLRGFHWNRHGYWSSAGYIPPGTKMVRNRTMNWANGRALSRAERRIGSFVRHASKYIRWVHPGKKGKAAPKFGRRKKR